MLLDKKIREELNDLFYVIKLQDKNSNASIDKQVKIEQILAYIEVLHAEVRKTSRKRKLVFVDCGAGNCYLSYVLYYYYTKIDKREIEIHCVDTNKRLMFQNSELAEKLNFKNIHFHASDISEFSLDKKVDVVYSLHACDTATDKTMHFGVRSEARFIFSVACCQHSLKIKTSPLKPVTRHKSFRDKLLMMVLDSMRALILEEHGYKVDIFDFVSSRYTEKNALVRAIKAANPKTKGVNDEYQKIKSDFKIRPYLEELINV